MDNNELLQAYEHLISVLAHLNVARQHIDGADSCGVRLPTNARQYVAQAHLWTTQELDTVRQEIRGRMAGVIS